MGLRLPNRIKYNKIQRTQLRKLKSLQSSNLSFFTSFKLIATKSILLNNKQIESLRQVVTRKIKTFSLIYLKIFSDLPRTSKPTACRMGRGKGGFKEWISKFNIGDPIFVIYTNPKNYLRLKNVLKKGIKKLPINLRLSFY